MVHIKDSIIILPKGEKHTYYIIICNVTYVVSKVDEEI